MTNTIDARRALAEFEAYLNEVAAEARHAYLNGNEKNYPHDKLPIEILRNAHIALSALQDYRAEMKL